MKKIILASVSAIALMGVAACSDTDDTTTQSTEPEVMDTQPVTPKVAPADEEAPATDDTTTQSVEPEPDGEAEAPADTEAAPMDDGAAMDEGATDDTTTQSIEPEQEDDANAPADTEVAPIDDGAADDGAMEEPKPAE